MSNPITFSSDDHLSASAEGWDIFAVNADESNLQLQKIDEQNTFGSDDEAWEFVITKAVSGSKLHQRAIAYIKQETPEEFEQFVKDVTVAEQNGQAMLLFSNGEGVSFPSMAEANDARDHYHKAVSLI